MVITQYNTMTDGELLRVVFARLDDVDPLTLELALRLEAALDEIDKTSVTIGTIEDELKGILDDIEAVLTNEHK